MHYEETQPEGNEEETVPRQETEERLENFEKHCHVDIETIVLRVSPYQCYHSGPGEKDNIDRETPEEQSSQYLRDNVFQSSQVVLQFPLLVRSLPRCLRAEFLHNAAPRCRGCRRGWG